MLAEPTAGRPPGVPACLHACVRACVPACLRACVRSCVHACLLACLPALQALLAAVVAARHRVLVQWRRSRCRDVVGRQVTGICRTDVLWRGHAGWWALGPGQPQTLPLRARGLTVGPGSGRPRRAPSVAWTTSSLYWYIYIATWQIIQQIWRALMRPPLSVSCRLASSSHAAWRRRAPARGEVYCRT